MDPTVTTRRRRHRLVALTLVALAAAGAVSTVAQGRNWGSITASESAGEKWPR